MTILDIESNGTVSIGINAPKDVLILRSELQQAASANQDSANALSSPEMVKELEAALFLGQAEQAKEKEK